MFLCIFIEQVYLDSERLLGKPAAPGYFPSSVFLHVNDGAPQQTLPPAAEAGGRDASGFRTHVAGGRDVSGFCTHVVGGRDAPGFCTHMAGGRDVSLFCIHMILSGSLCGSV